MTVDFGFTTGYNLALDKALVSTELAKGSSAVYRLTVTNTSAVDASGVTVVDTLPEGLVYRSSAGEKWSCGVSGQIVTCSYGSTLAAGAWSTVEVTTQVTISNGDLVNTAVVSSPRDSEDPPADNRDVVSGAVVTAVLPRTGASGTKPLVGFAALFGLGGIAMMLLDRKRRSVH